jgi:hypothetical protein
LPIKDAISIEQSSGSHAVVIGLKLPLALAISIIVPESGYMDAASDQEMFKLQLSVLAVNA